MLTITARHSNTHHKTYITTALNRLSQAPGLQEKSCGLAIELSNSIPIYRI